MYSVIHKFINYMFVIIYIYKQLYKMVTILYLMDFNSNVYVRHTEFN